MSKVIIIAILFTSLSTALLAHYGYLDHSNLVKEQVYSEDIEDKQNPVNAAKQIPTPGDVDPTEAQITEQLNSKIVVKLEKDSNHEQEPKITPRAITPATPPVSQTSFSATNQKRPTESTEAVSVYTAPTSTGTVIRSETSDQGVPSQIGALNQMDVWVLTNTERQKAGLSTLAWSKRLTAIAEAKALDMIAKQYFDHVSPSGVDLKKLAEIYAYEYISIGENLALGNFTRSLQVVDGWMNSPGHRANILSNKFTEIGIGLLIGNYEGTQVWFAVQEFGRPLTDCPLPDSLLQQKIIIYNEQLRSLETTLNNLEVEITQSSNDIALRNAKASDYNTIVKLYNSVAVTTKAEVLIFNNQVSAYNQCTKVQL